MNSFSWSGSFVVVILLIESFVSAHNEEVKSILQSLWKLNPVGEQFLMEVSQKNLHNKLLTLSPHYPTKQEIFKVLYHSEDSPYTSISPSETCSLGQYVSYAQLNAHAIQDYILRKLNGPPQLMIEVGTFVGSGAIFAWAPLVEMHKNNENAVVLCVDTWQGDINMRLADEFQGYMNLENGHPTLYTRFLKRVVEFGKQDTIFPLPMASLVAARLLSMTHWIVDVIYLDSAHEIGETFAEIMLYFQLLRPGGLLLGDDYDAFPAVKHDVDLFVSLFRDEVYFEMIVPNEWSIIKLK